METVKTTALLNLCIGCGVCKGICPKSCITFRRDHGLYRPEIDGSKCINCGLCIEICPGLGHSYTPKGTSSATVTGDVISCFNGWSRDSDIRHVSASGGIISTVIRKLLLNGDYDGAFCLDTYDYRKQLKTALYTPDDVSSCFDRSNAPKSRYIPVSHENAMAYMKANRRAKLIIVGTSCAIRALQAAVSKLNLDRQNYLFIGLFCDKVFNYNILTYFEDVYVKNASLTALHFKNKESGGWPGDMKFFPHSGEPFYVPLSVRAGAKAYFMPERCLYCVDKLNVCADISVGDNYTGKDESSLGSNSVIIRTEAGNRAINIVKDELEFRHITIEDIQKAQAIDMRLDNMYCGDLKAAHIDTDLDFNHGVPREMPAKNLTNIWQYSLTKLKTGAMYDSDPKLLKKQLRKDNKKQNIAVRFAKRCFRFIKRKLK